MPGSLGLAAYRALARRGDVPEAAPDRPRPDGELVWIHAGEPGNMLAVQDLAARLANAREGLNVLLTAGEDTAAAQIATSAPNVIDAALPGEHPDAVEKFLDHWRPDLCIWVWGGLRPNLILEAAERGCAMVMIDAEADGFDRRQNRWLPDLTRAVLARFDVALARSEAAARRLTYLGLPANRVERTSPLLAGGQALPCAESDLTELSSIMGGRPAWIAAQVQPDEVPTVIAAHRKALRLSHRLLLIIQPATPSQVSEIAAEATEANLTTVSWSEGEFPDETTQVMIAGDASEQGLFFRVAPVSFLGTTLVQGDDGCDPLNAAALGSAVLYGPRIRQYLGSYSRLAAAGAARIVNDADALGTAVSNIIAPDHAATMAHAGWEVISAGAALIDRVVDHVQDRLDARLSTP